MMKSKILVIAALISAFAVSSVSANNQLNEKVAVELTEQKTATFHVSGMCGMCKKRIEKAVGELEGVTSANWDVAKKELTVVFDEEKVSEQEIHEKVASVGHDTEKVKASDEVYNKLPGCCKYERS